MVFKSQFRTYQLILTMENSSNSTGMIQSSETVSNGFIKFICVGCVVTIILGLSNISVFLCMVKDKEMRSKPFPWLLAAMSVADFFATQIGSSILMAVVLNFERGLPSLVCKIYNWVGFTSVTVSLFSVTGMAIIRAKACLSVQVFKVHPRVVALLILAGYLAGLALAIVHTTDDGSPSLQSCVSPQDYFDRRGTSDYKIVSAVEGTLLLVCMGIVIISYMCISIKYCINYRNSVHVVSPPSDSRDNQGLQLATLGGLITGIFMLSFLPNAFLPVFALSTSNKRVQYLMVLVSNMVMYLQSGLNPYIYIWKCKAYRTILSEMLPSCFKGLLRGNRIQDIVVPEVLEPRVTDEKRVGDHRI